MTSLDEMRQTAIAQLQQAFPKNRRIKKIAQSNGERGLAHELTEYFGGKTWDYFDSDNRIIYRMSDPDYLWVLTDQAFLYYLPAFLTVALKLPSHIQSTSLTLSKITTFLPKFSRQQVEALLACFDFFVEYEKQEHEGRQGATQRIIRNRTLEMLEDTQLRIMVRLDELP
jgi:hypothetical protein